MYTVHAIKKGLKAIVANSPAVLLLWLTHLLLALTVAWPVFGWLRGTSHIPAAEEMLEGFSLPLLFDLLRYDFSTVVRLLGNLMFWLILWASLISTFISGGVLNVLANPGPEPFLERFFAGAGRYFARFLRLLLGAGLCAGVISLGLNAAAGALILRLSEGASELTPLLFLLGQGVLNAVIVTVFLLSLHYARIETVVNGATGMARTYLRSLVFVFRNIPSVFALIVFFVGLMGVVQLICGGVWSILPTTTWLFILLLMGIQQIAMLARSAFQVGLYGAELELYRLRRRRRAEREVVVVPEATVPPGAYEAQQAETSRTDVSPAHYIETPRL